MSFSCSLMMWECRCGPMLTRSMASSRNASSMSFLSLRAVSRAASLSTLARSAPVNPGVRRATASRSTSDGDRLAARVDLEDLVTSVHVGRRDPDHPVEPARAQQRRVEHVGSVGRGDQDHAAADVEAVHLDEQLVERLLALVVATAETGATVTADGIDLVDEDDCWRILLRLLEQVTDAGRADADEHLDEVGAGDRVERHARLTGNGPREQRLAGTGRAVQQDTLGDLRADGLELGRLLEELLDLAELLDRLVTAGDVGERRLRRVLADHLRLGLGELHDPAATALHAVHQEEEDHHEQDERQDAGDRTVQMMLGLRDLDVVGEGGLGAGRLFGLLLDEVEKLDALVAQPLGGDLLVVADPGRLDGLVAVDER